MRIAALLGSPRKMKGSTGCLLQSMVAAMEKKGAEVEIFFADGRNVKPCVACDACHRVGVCPQKDEFPQIWDGIQKADGIVLASPNYIFSVSAQIKAFIDRCCGPIHCQSGIGKYGAALVTSGGPGNEEVEEYLLRYLRGLGCLTVGSAGCQAWQLQIPQARDEILGRAAALGEALVSAIQNKQSFPEQNAERRSFMERMKELVTLQKDSWQFEYEFWKSHGRL